MQKITNQDAGCITKQRISRISPSAQFGFIDYVIM